MGENQRKREVERHLGVRARGQPKAITLNRLVMLKSNVQKDKLS